MCNAYNLKTSLAEIGRAAERQLRVPLVFPPGVTAGTANTPVPDEVFPRKDGLILRPARRESPSEGLRATVAYWNLVPWFHTGDLKSWKASTNNCRSETMATLPAFREAFRFRRCLIPATSFIEWTGPKGRKTAHQISLADGGLMFLAGLWDRVRVGEARLESYTMVMVDAVGEDDVAPFHNRQPIALDAGGAALWLDLAADPSPVVRSPPPGTLVADPPEPAAA
jgi:putative SOS response-associated peptidase YedK